MSHAEGEIGKANALNQVSSCDINEGILQEQLPN
jgi:hypothetical protein